MSAARTLALVEALRAARAAKAAWRRDGTPAARLRLADALEGVRRALRGHTEDEATRGAPR